MAMKPQQVSPVSNMEGTRLPSTPLLFWTCISTSGIKVKMMMKNVASKSNLALLDFCVLFSSHMKQKKVKNKTEKSFSPIGCAINDNF